MKYQNWLEDIKRQPTTHNWIKQQLDELDDKDVVDVLHGLRLLEDVFRMKLNNLTSK